MDTTTLISFLSGLGAGSILGALTKHWLAERARMSQIWLNEYKEAADGLLEAYAAALVPSDQTRKSFARWEARLQLLASHRVTGAVRALKESEPGSPERQEAHKTMIAGMRKDLGIAKNRGRDA